MTPSKIGIAGMGRMGAAMAARLLSQGCGVTVWNRSPQKSARLVEQGAVMAATPAELVSQCDIILSVLSDDEAVNTFYIGADGALSNRSLNGRIFVEMATLKPGTIKQVFSQVVEAGGRFVEAPVAGTVSHIEAGKLRVFLGGDEEDIRAVEPVLRYFSQLLYHMGGVGTGSIMKLVNNVNTILWVQAMAESLALGSAAGLDVKKMVDALSTSASATPLLTLKRHIVEGNDISADAVAGSIGIIRKDLLSIINTASALGVPVPAVTGALTTMSAACAAGWGERDMAEAPRFHREALVRR